MTIKSFRGQLAGTDTSNGSVDTISLHTNNGSIGYRIVKLEIMPTSPGTVTYENTVKVYSVSQSSASVTIDFADNTLLAAGFMSGSTSTSNSEDMYVVFDNTVFNQDIYITNISPDAASGANYYIELEQIKLDLNENTVATLKDIRNVKSQ